MTPETERPFDHTGSSFDSFLEEEGILAEIQAVAIQRVTEWQQAQLADHLRPRR